MGTHTVRLLIPILCVTLAFMIHQGVIATVIKAVLSSIYDLNGDPMLAGPQPPFPAQAQNFPGLQSRMDPEPDFGYASYNGTGKLQGKVAIITGGDSGIGRAVALAFAREGASVVISYLNETEDAQTIQQIIQQEGHNCTLIPGDITDELQCQRIIDTTVALYNRIDILVNNAAYLGKSVNTSIEGMNHDRILYTFRTNIIATFDLTRYAIPYMRKGSSIINVGSIQAYYPAAEILDYATTKAAIVAFTKGLAAKMLEKGIRVNCIAPGPVWTPLVVSSNSPEQTAAFGTDSPMKRPAQPRELAPAFVYLASGTTSSYISGEILAVTGSMLKSVSGTGSTTIFLTTTTPSTSTQITTTIKSIASPGSDLDHLLLMLFGITISFS